MIYNNILELIGQTPLVKINRLNTKPGVNIYIKLEGQNPSGSIKDRIGLSMITAAENNGELTKDKIILEPTSGNTGIGIALVATIKGYRTILTMSSAMSMERKKVLRAFGAEIIETDPKLGTDGAIMKAKELYAQNPSKYWMPYQFSNPNNPLAHYQTTAQEIIDDLPTINYLVAGLGTSGTVMGITKKLKEHNPKIKIIGIEPNPGHKIAGLKNMTEAIVPEIYQEKQLDQKLNVSDEEAYQTARDLARHEGILVGMSAGAAMWGALQIAQKIDQGNIVAVMPDRGEKYLSTTLFQ